MSGNYLLYLLFIGGFLTGAYFYLHRFKDSLTGYLVLWTVYACSAGLLSLSLARDMFDIFSLMSMGIFVGGPFLLALSACYSWPRYRIFASVFSVLSVVSAFVGVDAFLVEPHWLEVRRETVCSSKVTRPLRVAIIADLQTDSVGDFERQVLERVVAERPDVVLFPGDFIQARAESHRSQVSKLNALLRKLRLQAPLGVYATQGDSEKKSWPEIFKGLPVTAFARSGTSVNNEIAVTGLTLSDSFQPTFEPPVTGKFHIIVGHRPGFSLDVKGGDLLVAGHTHGGQVKIPFFGPILTFSKVPRLWGGGGLIDLGGERRLVISRGIGMERGNAPRLRFCCRPELVMVDVVPASASRCGSPAIDGALSDGSGVAAGRSVAGEKPERKG